MLVSEKWHVRRSVVLDHVLQACGVDLLVSVSETDLPKAIAVLAEMKARGFDPRRETNQN
jgi:hypothetical protein